MIKFKFSLAAVLAISTLSVAGGDIVPIEQVAPEVVVSDSVQYYSTVYVWGAGMKGETANGADIDVRFSDILDNLDFTFMGNFGVQKGKWTFGTDVIYLKIGNKPNTYLPPLDVTLTNVQMKSWVITPTVAYRVMESEKLKLDVLAGARYLYMKSKITFDNIAELSDSGSVLDGIVGVRGQYDLNEKWNMPFQLDVGTGDTDMTWQAFAGIGYEYENFDLIAGYRYMEWDFDDGGTGGKVYNDLSISGPIIGAKFRF